MVSVDVACPPEQRIAAFVDGTLPAQERAELQRHLDDCADCFELVATLASQHDEPLPRIDARLREAALARPASASWVRRHLPALAAAAAVIVAVAWWAPRAQSPVLTSHRPGANAPSGDAVTRSGARGRVIVDEPRDDHMVGAQPEVRWTAPQEAVAFEIQVTSETGDVLWQRQVSGSERAVRIETSLPPNRVCYLKIAAELPEGRRLTSNVVKIHSARP